MICLAPEGALDLMGAKLHWRTCAELPRVEDGKAREPCSISYTTQPSAHMSTGRPR